MSKKTSLVVLAVISGPCILLFQHQRTRVDFGARPLEAVCPQNSAGGAPITQTGAQQTGGAGVTVGQPDQAPPPTPEQMAATCNRFATLKQQQTSLQHAVDSDYAEMEWAGAYFQKNATEFEGWKQFVQAMQEFRDAEKSVNDALEPGLTAIDLAQGENPVLIALEKLASSAPLNVAYAATGQYAKSGIQSLSGATEEQLKLLSREQGQMKQDVSALNGVATQLRGMGSAPCDTTKLVRKEPTEASNGTSETTPPTSSAKKVKSGGSHTGLWLLGGGAAAAGVAAYAVGAALTNQCSNSQAIAAVEAEIQTCFPGGVPTSNPAACQNAANQSAQAVTSYCSCQGKTIPGASVTMEQELAALQSGAGCQ